MLKWSLYFGLICHEVQEPFRFNIGAQMSLIFFLIFWIILSLNIRIVWIQYWYKNRPYISDQDVPKYKDRLDWILMYNCSLYFGWEWYSYRSSSRGRSVGSGWGGSGQVLQRFRKGSLLVLYFVFFGAVKIRNAQFARKLFGRPIYWGCLLYTSPSPRD